MAAAKRQHKRRRHGRRTVKAVYTPLPEYRSRGSTQAAGLLSAVADALNACEKAGILVQLAHGATITDQGYVIAPFDEDPGHLGQRWVARTRMLTEFPGAQPPCEAGSANPGLLLARVLPVR